MKVNVGEDENDSLKDEHFVAEKAEVSSDMAAKVGDVVVSSFPSCFHSALFDVWMMGAITWGVEDYSRMEKAHEAK